MNLKEKLEAKKDQETIAELRRQLADSNKQQSMLIGQVDKARRAKFTKIVPAKVRARLDGDKVRVICCDLHGSKMDRKAVAAFLADVRRLQPDEIFLLGDMIDCGGFLAAHHTWGYLPETTYTYDDDILAGNTFLDQLREAAPNALIEYLEGNHEQRISKWAISTAMRGGNPKDAEGLLRRNAPQYLLRLEDRGIKFYEMGEHYDGLAVPGFIKRGKCYFTHGSFVTAKHATATIQAKIAGNVVFGNSHREQAERVNRLSVGVVGAWNPGCLCLQQPLWQNTNPTDWSHGYAIQFVARSQNFLHVNIPLIGESLLAPFLESTNEVTAR